jgi:hypothetical protein
MNWYGSGFIPIIVYPVQAVGSITPPVPSNNFLLLNGDDFALLNGDNLSLL